TVGVGALVLSRPHGVTPSGTPTVAQRRASQAPAGGNVNPVGDPDGPVTAMVHRAASNPAAPAPMLAAATGSGAPRHAAPASTGTRSALSNEAVAQAIPDSLFDHSADVDFVLDPVKVRRERGRGYTPVANPVRGEAASITF